MVYLIYCLSYIWNKVGMQAEMIKYVMYMSAKGKGR